MCGLGLGFDIPIIKFHSYSTTSWLWLHLLYFHFLMCFSLYPFFLNFLFLDWCFLKKITSSKPGGGGFGDITNSEQVVGGLFSCGKPQPISAFVSDEAAARLSETRLHSLTPSRKLTKAVSLPGVIAAKQLLVIESFDVLIKKKK